jgi:hypothetical protein
MQKTLLKLKNHDYWRSRRSAQDDFGRAVFVSQIGATSCASLAN